MTNAEKGTIIKPTYEYVFIYRTEDEPHGERQGQKRSHLRRESDEPNIEVLYDLSELFKVFGDSTRIRILTALTAGEMCVLHLAEHLDMGQSAVSHQLRILRAAGLVRPRRSGKTVYYALDDDHVREILESGLEHILHKQQYLSLIHISEPTRPY